MSAAPRPPDPDDHLPEEIRRPNRTSRSVSTLVILFAVVAILGIAMAIAFTVI